MDTKEYILALDQGSSSSRTFAFNTDGELCFKSQSPLALSYLEPGRAEYDALELLRSQTESLTGVLNQLPQGFTVKALGLAAQRSTVVFWDSETGLPLAPALSWQDGRAVAETAAAKLTQTEVHNLTGLYNTPYYSAPKIRWAINNIPAVSAAFAKGRLLAAPVASFFLWKLSQGNIYALDPTQAQRTLLFNIKNFLWEPKLLQAFGLDVRILPQIKPSIGNFGTLTVDGAALPVKAVMGDQQAALLGLGAIEAGSAALNYGTGAFLLVNSGAKLVKIPGLLNSAGWQFVNEAKSCYFLESVVNSAATSLEWLRRNFGFFSDISEVDGICRLSRNRIFCLPALGGLGTPDWDFSVFTTLTGMSPMTGKNDIVRSVVEGIAYQIGHAVALMRERGVVISEIKASGGLSKIDWLLQFQADITGVKILRVEEFEATALGAAIGAAAAVGIVLPRPLKIQKEFLPSISCEDREKLLKAWRLFVRDTRKTSISLQKIIS